MLRSWAGLVILLIAVLSAIGYCENIYKAFALDESLRMFVMRVVGVFIPFIGSIIGWF